MKIDPDAILAAGAFTSDSDGKPEWFNGTVYSGVFRCEIPVSILLEAGTDSVSRKQWMIVDDFASLSPDSLEHFATQLYQHWQLYEEEYEEGEFVVADAADIWKYARAKKLLIWYTDEWQGRAANVRFDIDWDPEHGISVVMYDGILKGAHDVQRYYSLYEDQT